MDLGLAFLATIDLLPEPMLLVSVEGSILAVNSALAQQLSLPRQSLINRQLIELASDCDEPPLLRLRRAVSH